MESNLVITIQLPAGLGLTNGAVLQSPVQFQVASGLTPFYGSIEIAKVHGGIYLNKISDVTIAGMIYLMSKQADALTWSLPIVPPSFAPFIDFQEVHFRNFMQARQNWVTFMAVRQLMLNTFDLNAVRGNKTLANFSVGRQEFSASEGMPGKLADLSSQIKDWEIALKSGGSIGHAGHVKPRMAAKGLYDDSDSTPGRTWINSGPGANTYSMTGVSSAGGRGKMVKFFSPVVTGCRAGRGIGMGSIGCSFPRFPGF